MCHIFKKINALIRFVYLFFFSLVRSSFAITWTIANRRKFSCTYREIKKIIRNEILNCKDTVQQYLLQLMTSYLLKALSFSVTVKSLFIVIHIRNLKSLVNLGSTLLNFKNYYQKGRIIVKTKQVIVKMQKNKKAHF